MMNADRMGGHAAVNFSKPTPDRFSRNRSLYVAKWNVWNFAGDPMGDGYYSSFYAQLRNYWSFNVQAHAGTLGLQRSADAGRADDAVSRVHGGLGRR